MLLSFLLVLMVCVVAATSQCKFVKQSELEIAGIAMETM